LQKLSGYAADPRTKVQDELINGWNYFDPHEYAQRVLVDAPLRNGRLKIDDLALLPAVQALRRLRHLQVEILEGLTLDRLIGIPALVEVNARRVPTTSLGLLTEHKNLREVGLWKMTGILEDVTPVLSLPRLRRLTLNAKRSTLDLGFICGLPKLDVLQISVDKGLNDFTPLLAQTSLRTLRLWSCCSLSNLDVLCQLTALTVLMLEQSSLGEDGLRLIAANFPRLRKLDVEDSDWVTDIAPIVDLPLEVLVLNDCRRLTKIGPIGRIQHLNFLALHGTPIADLSPIEGLDKLRTLILGGCEENSDLTPLRRLSKLHELRLLDVPERTDVSPLMNLRNLMITMYEGQRVRGLDRLHRTTRIRWVTE
jgi:hypothetical protein